MNTIAIINGLICAAVFLRIVTYKRNGARYKPVMSMFAAILVFATGGEAMLCLLGFEQCVTVPQLIISIGMAFAIFAHKGNVARCLPLPKHKRRILNNNSSQFNRRAI
ncbi:MAG: phage holin family protein [Agitococcus sp.]|nr:phage holin family protein [Agitococcus sp.]